MVVNLPISLLRPELPNNGIWREVIGMESDIVCWKTVNDSNTVTPEKHSLWTTKIKKRKVLPCF